MSNQSQSTIIERSHCVGHEDECQEINKTKNLYGKKKTDHE